MSEDNLLKLEKKFYQPFHLWDRLTLLLLENQYIFNIYKIRIDNPNYMEKMKKNYIMKW